MTLGISTKQADRLPTQKPIRNPSVELFRCLLMFLIVWDHSYFHGIWTAATDWWTLLFSTAVMWHVDGFIAISGWFGIKFTWRKFLKLWGLCAFYTCLSILYALFIDRSLLSFKIFVVQGGWFVGAYFFLMMIAPLLNAGIENLYRQSKHALIAMWLVFAFAVSANWAPFGLMTGVLSRSAGPQSVVNLLFVYVSARCARLLELDKLPLKKKLLGPAIYLSVVLIVGGAASLYRTVRGLPFEPIAFNNHLEYNAPHVWIMAIAMLLIFVSHIKIPEILGRLVAFCAPSMLGIYLLSDTTAFGTLLFTLPQSYLHNWSPPLATAASAVLCFSLCMAVDLLRRLSLQLMLMGISSIELLLRHRKNGWTSMH